MSRCSNFGQWLSERILQRVGEREEMGNDAKTSKTKNPKKANLSDHHYLKHILDESVTEIVTSRGYVEDVRMSNIRLLSGTIIIIVALVAQFYPKKFPENRTFLISLKENEEKISCYWLSILDSGKYIVLNMLLQLIINTKEKNAILFTYPPPGSVTSTGLVVSSKLPRFSDLYTLTMASADPKSISANKPVEFTQSITKWFTKDGLLVEGLFWKDVEGLVDEYAKEKKSK
ncbi:hypothetical protein Nepgr_021193 [Nepenthes gracilis]|uniref:Signal peptidase complex subunit 2 n=1 Tax=Nepenthes gracilis TaxID=150966 RepID=A0AAD3SZB3_NEPGR|nr:hypothetical protein Nepgr_021193 [Nepenthes gracilis]